MKKGKKKRIIVPGSVSQHIEEEFRKNREFRAAYTDEVTKLEIGRKIKQLRIKKKLSQIALAHRMKTTQQTVSRLEDIKNAKVTLVTLAKVAMALGVTLSIDFVPQKNLHLKRV